MACKVQLYARLVYSRLPNWSWWLGFGTEPGRALRSSQHGLLSHTGRLYSNAPTALYQNNDLSEWKLGIEIPFLRGTPIILILCALCFMFCCSVVYTRG